MAKTKKEELEVLIMNGLEGTIINEKEDTRRREEEKE